jgi:hypothetical protein
MNRAALLREQLGAWRSGRDALLRRRAPQRPGIQREAYSHEVAERYFELLGPPVNTYGRHFGAAG